MQKYSFNGKIWKYSGDSAWYFITMPIEYADEIRALKSLHIGYSRGFGSLKVSATIGNITWNTSIFPDNVTKSYLLPIKKSVREINKIIDGDIVKIELIITGI